MTALVTMLGLAAAGTVVLVWFLAAVAGQTDDDDGRGDE